ncbi:MAG: epoxyqueuosine reductase QueH [Bacilli bacterium]|nr:epoxyqueuosine reductase QueH [Bacilli bacterium]
MKINYQLELEKIIANLSAKPTLLLHACCGVCSSYVLEYLTKYFDITVLYYNPNIYPEEEYQKRLETQKEIIKKMKLDIEVLEIGYNDQDFWEIAKGLEKEKEGGARCSRCYYLRLEQTALLAKEKNFDYFTTTLSVSPYKDSQKLNKIGMQLEEKYNLKYLYSDFKKKDGYKRSNELARIYGLYRQDYCGCKYSKEERLLVSK